MMRHERDYGKGLYALMVFGVNSMYVDGMVVIFCLV